MDKKRIAMAGGTLACIGAIGFFMQSGANVPGAGTPAAPVASAGMVNTAPGVNNPQTPVDISEVSLTSAETETWGPPAVPAAEVQLVPQPEAPVAAPPSMDKPVEAAMDEAPVETPLAAPLAAVADAPVETPLAVSLLETPTAKPKAAAAPMTAPKTAAQCEITLTGSEIAGALVKLDLQAPCLPNERVTMHHNGMMFTETTDAAGALNISVPALAENAVFIASFANSEGAVANVKVTSLELYDRAVVQSDFASGVGLHALEYGADYDDAGHIWADAVGDIADAAIGRGGFMIQLGNPEVSEGAMAQVYTFPSGLAEEAGDIELSVEIEVTSTNCGHDIEAQALQISAGGQPKVQTLDLTMPDCDAVGDFLVLKNLVNDLKVAANTQ